MAKIKGFALYNIHNNHAKFYGTEVKIIFLPVFTLYEWDRLFKTPFHKITDTNIPWFVFWGPLDVYSWFGFKHFFFAKDFIEGISYLAIKRFCKDI